MTVTLSAAEVQLLLDSLESYRQSLSEAALEVQPESRRAEIAEVQRNILTLEDKLRMRG